MEAQGEEGVTTLWDKDAVCTKVAFHSCLTSLGDPNMVARKKALCTLAHLGEGTETVQAVREQRG